MKRLRLLLAVMGVMMAMMIASSVPALAKTTDDGWTGNTGKSSNGGAWVYHGDKGGGKPIVVNKNMMIY